MGGARRLTAQVVWSTTLLLTLVALVLGFVGFAHGVPPDFDHPTPTDVVYYTLQLFVLGSDPLGTTGPFWWPIEWARFLAPAATVIAVVQTIALLFDDWITAVWVRRRKGHAIVVGDGPAAALLAEQLLEAKKLVAVVGAGIPLDGIRGQWLSRPGGDPTAEETLRQAGITKAGSVFAISTDWVTNAAVALAVSKAGNQDVRVYAQVQDEVMVAALRARHPVSGGLQQPLEVVSLDAIAARVLLDTHPPGYDAVPGGFTARPIVIAGFGAFPQMLLREIDLAQRQAGIRRAVTVVTERRDDAERVSTDLHHLDVQITDTIPPGSAAIFYVCWLDPDRTLRTALSYAPSGTGLTVMCLPRLAGLGEALNEQTVFNADGIKVFGILDEACDPAGIEGDLTEKMARTLHSNYVATQLRTGVVPGGSCAPWELLADHLRADNRSSASDLRAGLVSVGATVLPLGPTFPAFAFTTEEISSLAEAEHERWCVAKRKAGFVFGQDRTTTTHPDLKPWEELDAETRQKDADIIVGLPEVLASAGMQIVRTRDL